MKRFARPLLATVSLLACVACAGQNQGHAVMVPWAALPIPVQRTFVKELPNQNLTAVERESNKGAVVYEAKNVKVDSDGRLLTANPANSVEVSWKHVPKAVRSTILKNNGGMKLDTVEKGTLNGHTVYVAKICQPGGDMRMIQVAKNGKLLSH